MKLRYFHKWNQPKNPAYFVPAGMVASMYYPAASGLLATGPGESRANGHRRPKVGRVIGVPGKLLHSGVARVATAFVGVAVGVVHYPVLGAIFGNKKAVVARPVSAVSRAFYEYWGR